MLSFCPVPPNLIQMDSSWFLQNLPENVSKEAKNLLDNLLQQDPCDRLGCNLETDGEEALRRHEFFKALDWGKMERREVPAPFVPDSDSQKSSKYFNSTYML